MVIGPIGDIGTTPGGGGVIDDPINITDPAQRTEYANLNFNPYNKKLENESVIRYLYTGREMNIETNDYYYRWRVVDTSIGRFTSKDHIDVLNLYFYTDDDPMNYIDPLGLEVFKIGFKFSINLGAIGFSVEVGVAFGSSQRCGESSGGYLSGTVHGGGGLGASGGVQTEVTTHETVGELEGTSMGASGGLYWGGGANITSSESYDDEGNLVNTGSGFGVGVGYRAKPGGGASADITSTGVGGEKKNGKCE